MKHYLRLLLNVACVVALVFSFACAKKVTQEQIEAPVDTNLNANEFQELVVQRAVVVVLAVGAGDHGPPLVQDAREVHIAPQPHPRAAGRVLGEIIRGLAHSVRKRRGSSLYLEAAGVLEDDPPADAAATGLPIQPWVHS